MVLRDLLNIPKAFGVGRDIVSLGHEIMMAIRDRESDPTFRGNMIDLDEDPRARRIMAYFQGRDTTELGGSIPEARALAYGMGSHGERAIELGLWWLGDMLEAGTPYKSPLPYATGAAQSAEPGT